MTRTAEGAAGRVSSMGAQRPGSSQVASKRGALRRCKGATTAALGVAALIGAPASYVGPRQERPSPPQMPDTRVKTVAVAWLDAARCTATGRPDTAAYLEAAWHDTAAWWLRPAAFTTAVGLGLAARFLRLLAPSERPQQQQAAIAPVVTKGLSEADAPVAQRALQDLQTPFFATGARWDTLQRGMTIEGNLREGATVDWLHSSAPLVVSRLEAALGRQVTVHLLRTEKKDGRRISEPSNVVTSAAGRSPTYHLWVTDRDAEEEAAAFYRGLATSFGSLAACAACAAYGGTPTALPATTALVTATLLLAAMVARQVIAHRNGVKLAPPIFLPSPQFGIIGIVQTPLSPAPSRSVALEVALAGPLALGIFSTLLLAFGATVGTGTAAAVPPGFESMAWPLAMLAGPGGCDAVSLAGAYGLLAAGLALLPQSPDGQIVFRSLSGRSTADWIQQVAIWLYPVLGLISAEFNGFGWAMLPFWWIFLLINLPQRPSPPQEEVTEVTPMSRYLAVAGIIAAVIVTEPWPLQSLPW